MYLRSISSLHKEKQLPENEILFLSAKKGKIYWSLKKNEKHDSTDSAALYKVIYTHVDRTIKTATFWNFSKTSLILCMQYLKAR